MSPARKAVPEPDLREQIQVRDSDGKKTIGAPLTEVMAKLDEGLEKKTAWPARRTA